MMLLLPRDIITHGPALRRTDGESAITLLPLERALADFVMHPARGDAFDFTQHIRQAMGGAQPNEEMHMVGHAADGGRDSVEVIDGAAEEGVQTFAPRGQDERRTILRGKDEVVMERKVRGGHDGRHLPAPLPGRTIFLC